MKKVILLHDGTNLCETHPELGNLALDLVDENSKYYFKFKIGRELIDAFNWGSNSLFWDEVYRSIDLDEKEAKLKGIIPITITALKEYGNKLGLDILKNSTLWAFEELNLVIKELLNLGYTEEAAELTEKYT